MKHDPLHGSALPTGLAAALARGDMAAFDVLYRSYKDCMLRAAYRVLGDRQSALDVLQDLFVAIVQKPQLLSSVRELEPYLIQMATNRARDVQRQRKPESMSEVPQFESTSRSPLDVAAAREERLVMTSRLLHLPERQREVVLLHVFNGQTIREIASVIGASVNTVQARFRYALAALRRQMFGRS